MSPSGVRVGASDEMVFSPLLNLSAAIVQGGWALEGKTRLFYYITKHMHVSQASLVLGNHANPTMHCPMYCVDHIVDESNKQKVHNYINKLFGHNVPGAEALDIIKAYLFAVLLYWFDDSNTTYLTTNTITKRMLSIGR
eukprot:2838371-Ditylum_brightwellii.AAC.1